ncbi:MAG: hypothetical protein BJ554DRAFT_2747, partial [Olpidium bornovanus]
AEEPSDVTQTRLCLGDLRADLGAGKVLDDPFLALGVLDAARARLQRLPLFPGNLDDLATDINRK